MRNQYTEKPSVYLSATNRSISDIPVTISAFSMGMLVMAIMIVRGVFHAVYRYGAAVPIIVAIRADRTAIISVVYKAFIMLSF